MVSRNVLTIMPPSHVGAIGEHS